MKILKKILKWGGIGLLVLIVIFLGLSEYKIRSAPDPVSVALELPTDAASLLEGERLARTRGCMGCHTETLEGEIFFDEPVFARIITPNLTHFLQNESVEVLEAAIRQGIGIDGRALVAMPSDMFSYLSDEDTAKIIAYLKTMPEVENDLPGNFFGPLSRFIFIKGDFKNAPSYIAEKPALKYSTISAPELAQGEYLAMTVCSECHGLDLKGVSQGDFSPPDLSITYGYSAEEFDHFMKTGEATGGRDVGLMTKVSKSRFSYLWDDEVAALYAYLIERAEKEMETEE